MTFALTDPRAPRQIRPRRAVSMISVADNSAGTRASGSWIVAWTTSSSGDHFIFTARGGGP